MPLKAAVVRRQALQHVEELPSWANTVIGDLLSEVSRLDERIAQYDRHIQAMARQSRAAQQLMQLNGIGKITATALVSTVGNGHDYSCGHQFCARLRLVPGQYSWRAVVVIAAKNARMCWALLQRGEDFKMPS